MGIRDLLFYGLLAAIPAYFFNKWLIKKIRPKESFSRFLLFMLFILAFAFAYTYLAVFIISNYIWKAR